MCTFDHLHTVVFVNCCLVVFSGIFSSLDSFKKIDLEVSHSPSSHILGMIPFQGFFLEDNLPPTNKKGVLCNRAMGIPINGISWIPIELTHFFWPVKDLFTAFPWEATGVFRVIRVTCFALGWWDIEDLAQNLHQTGCLSHWPIESIIFQQSRISVYKKTCTTSFSMGFFSWFKVTNHKISQKRRLQKDLDISSSAPSCCAELVGLPRVPHRCPWDPFHYEVVKF